MSQLNVLVSGGGIAGSVVAYWLGKAGITVTVVERAPELRKSGQGIDIRGKGLDIIRDMGVEEAIKARTTKEGGLQFVDENNKSLLTLAASGDKSFTAEIEIIRSDLAKILYDAALSTNKVKYEFGTSITTLTQTSTGVQVELDNGQSHKYDLLVAADGFTSRTRNLILGSEKSKSGIVALNSYVAYFTIPSEPQDSPYGRWYTTTNSRAATLRPRAPGQTSAYLTVFTSSAEPKEAQASNDIDVQKRFISKTFANVGWEVPRMLKQMADCGSDDFYFQEVGQIKLGKDNGSGHPTWHNGPCALAGDTAHCPSPFTGMGTTLAIIGAYVLAGEIVKEAAGKKQQPDFEAAFTSYENVLGSYVADIQKLPLGGALVNWLNPQTAWGVWILRTVLWLVGMSGLPKLAGWFSGIDSEEKVKVPEYQF